MCRGGRSGPPAFGYKEYLLENLSIKTCILFADRDYATAILLYRIAYWHPKMKVVNGGKNWIAKSLEDWEEDSGLTKDVLKRAFSALKSYGYIVREVHKFGGKTVGFTRLSTRFLEMVKVPIGTNRMVPIDPNWMGSIRPNVYTLRYLQRDTNRASRKKKKKEKKEFQEYKNITDIYKNDLRGIFLGEIINSKRLSEIEFQNHKEDEMSESKIQRKLREQNSVSRVFDQYQESSEAAVSDDSLGELLETASTCSEFEKLWRVLVLRSNPKVFVKSWINQEKGQINKFRKEFDDATLRVVFHETLTAWDEYCWHVKEQSGYSNLPGSPSVGFLFKFRAEAVSWVKDRLETNLGAGKNSFGRHDLSFD